MIRLAYAKQYVVLGAGLLCLPMSLALAQSKNEKAPQVALDQLQDFQSGLTAIQQGVEFQSESLYEIAGVKFERVFKTSATSLSQKDRQKLVEVLFTAWLKSEQPQKVLDFILTHEEFEGEAYWAGQAHLALRQYSDAEFHTSKYLSIGGKYLPYAKLTLGKALVGQGKAAQAREVFKELQANPSVAISREAEWYLSETEIATGRAKEVLSRLSGESLAPELEFLKAEALLSSGEARKAEKVLLKLRDSKDHLNQNLADAVQLRLVKADAKQGDYKGAGKRLLKFINQQQDTHLYPQAFQLFNELVAKTEIDPIESLTEWAALPESPSRQRLALENLAKWHLLQNRPSAAAEVLESLRSLFPEPSVQSQVVPQLIAIYGELGEDRKVLNLADQWRLQPGMGQDMGVDFLTGLVQFKRGDYQAAAALFEKASALGKNLLQQRTALYNAALSKLLADEDEGYLKFVQALKATENPHVPSETSSEHLELEGILRDLRDLHVDAENSAQQFLKNSASNSRIGELYLALAEFYIHLPTPKPDQAMKTLDALPEDKPLNETQKMRKDFLRIWINDLAQNASEVIRAGVHYLQAWPESKERELVRLKIGQAYFQIQDYSNAESAFEQLAEDFPESPYAEVALYFAGKSAMNLQSPAAMERAWALWTEVVSLKGSLAFDARREQVQIRRRQMKYEEALSILEDLLTSYAQITEEERWALILEKGENLALLSRENPARFSEAVSVFESLAHDESLPRAWRGRAGVLLSQLFQQASKKPEALEACYNVVNRYLNEPVKPEELSPMDYTWLYRAGFSALDMLEERQQWTAAAELGDRLAAIGGERAQAAKQRAERIRLEHFIWKRTDS